MEDYLLGCAVLGAGADLEHVDVSKVERTQERGVLLGYAAALGGALLLGYLGHRFVRPHRVQATAVGAVAGWALGAAAGPVFFGGVR